MGELYRAGGQTNKLMNIDLVEVDRIKPYENNPRNNKKAIDAVAKSLKEFGFQQPIVVDENGIIIVGHTRYEAAKKLGLEYIPVKYAELDEQKAKAYRIADNKTNELASWDDEKLLEELEALTIDMSDFGLDIDDIDIGYYGDERERTYNAVNLNEYDNDRSDGFYQMPVITAEHYIPDSLLPFNYVLSKDKFESGVHFFIDDYQFERIWNSPEKYMERLSKFTCCLTPDFSLYMDMPIAMQIWNVYRSRMIGQIMQDNGIKVIPTLSWSSEDSYSFCFDGIEKGGTVAVSTVGCVRDAKEAWYAGMDEAMQRLEPSCVLVYGSDIGYEFKTKVKIFNYRKWV